MCELQNYFVSLSFKLMPCMDQSNECFVPRKAGTFRKQQVLLKGIAQTIFGHF